MSADLRYGPPCWGPGSNTNAVEVVDGVLRAWRG